MLLGQAGDLLQIELVLEPLEGFIDAPTLVIKVADGADGADGKAGGIEQIAHQHAHFAIGRDMVNQASLRGRADIRSCSGSRFTGHARIRHLGVVLIINKW
jgi:hypothetical protein